MLPPLYPVTATLILVTGGAKPVFATAFPVPILVLEGQAASPLFWKSRSLALHAMACVAGFIAGSSLPQQASNRSGLSKLVHEKAGPLAIAFVCCATAFSLFTQADILGHTASTLAWHLHMSPGLLIVGLLPHAILELTALFLPLAAWVIASRRDRWDELLAATCVTVAIALPVLLAASAIEIYGSPKLILALAGQ